MRKGYPFKRRESGVVAIEFALGIMAFLLMIFYWIEVSYLGFVNSVVDYAVVEASRVSRYQLDSHDYDAAVVDILANENSLWMAFLDVDKFESEVFYCEDVGGLKPPSQDSQEHGCTASSNGSPLAIYELTYPYQPLFAALLMSSAKSMDITREVIMVQEHERG